MTSAKGRGQYRERGGTENAVTHGTHGGNAETGKTQKRKTDGADKKRPPQRKSFHALYADFMKCNYIRTLSDIESEQDNVAVLHHVFLAFASYKTFFFCRCH